MSRWEDTHDDQLAAMSDAELLRADQRTTGELGDRAMKRSVNQRSAQSISSIV